VRSDLPAGEVSLHDHRLQSLGVGLGVAGIGRVVLESRVHPARASDQRTVTEDLERPDPEPLVADPGAKAGIQADFGEVVDVSADRVQQICGDHHRGANSQPAGVARELVRRELGRALADPAPGDPRIAHAGQALGEVAVVRVSDRVRELLERAGEHEPLHE